MNKRCFVAAALTLGAGALALSSHGRARGWLDGLHYFSMPSADSYNRLSSLALGRFYRRVAREVASASPTGRVLDVGCGPGQVACLLAEAAPEAKVAGLDVLPEMVELARRRIAARSLGDRVELVVGDVGALPFPDENFDVVVSTLSLHHWPDARGGLAEVHRVLRPGGQAIIYDIAGWIGAFEGIGLGHHDDLPTLIERGPFVFGAISRVYGLGPVPIIVRAILRRADRPRSESATEVETPTN